MNEGIGLLNLIQDVYLQAAGVEDEGALAVAQENQFMLGSLAAMPAVNGFALCLTERSASLKGHFT